MADMAGFLSSLFGGPGKGGALGIQQSLEQRGSGMTNMPTYGNTPQQEAASRTSPLLQALLARQQQEQPGVIRNAFSGFADRGLGNSGVATRGVGDALAKFNANYQDQRNQINRQGLQDVQQERYQAQNLAQTQRTFEQQREANKPWWSKL